MTDEGEHDLQFLRHFSKLRVLQTTTTYSATDIKHLLTGYCVFDSNRVRYRLVKDKKVAVIGVVCLVDDGVLVLSSLTKAKLSVSMVKASKYKVGEALLLLSPESTTVNGKWRLEINQEDNVIRLGKAIDFGFCSFKDPKSQSCMEVVNKAVCHMCEKHAKKEFEELSKTIARRQELGGASIYNELRFNYKTRYASHNGHEWSVDRRPNKRKTKPFYDAPNFEKEVDEMPKGKEKNHLEALLRRLKPKQTKTMQEQMQEHLTKKHQSSTSTSETTDTTENSIPEAEVNLKTPQKPSKKEPNFVMLDSVEPRPTAIEIENLIFSLKKTSTTEFKEATNEAPSTLLLMEDQAQD